MTYEERLALAVGRNRATERDDEAITALVREHTAFVYRIAYSILHDAHDAEDVTQETFVRVLKNVHRLPLIRDQRAWLARIAWRLSVTKWNRTKKKRTLEPSLEMDGAKDRLHGLAVNLSERTAESDEAVELIGRMTAALPEHLRHPLMLSAIDEMSSREVAETLNITEGTVRTRVHRARKILKEKLRRLLGKDYGS
jgi:RNA polymerase sigma-70 factor (ECF subfamily)